MVGSGRISNSSETLLLSLLPTRKKKIQSKMKVLDLECSQHYTSISDAQGQITPQSVVGSGLNSNSFKLSCMSLLPTRMKMIQSTMDGLEWSQHCSHYKSTKIFQDPQGQLTPQSMVGFDRISISYVLLWLF